MNVVEVMQKVLIVTNSVIRETALPDFAGAANHAAEGVRVPTLDELHGMFERDVASRSMKLEAAFSAISVESYQEEAAIVFDNEKSSALPSREGNEVSSGRGDQSSRLQGQTSTAKAAIFA